MRWRKQTHLCYLEKGSSWVANAGLYKGTAPGHTTPNPFILSVWCAGSRQERAAALRQNSRSYPTGDEGKGASPRAPRGDEIALRHSRGCC